MSIFVLIQIVRFLGS